MPDWAQWLVMSSNNPQQKLPTVEYMLPVNFPITENATVQHIIHLFQATMKCRPTIHNINF